jgi:putative ABC transport system permease protein
MSTLIQDLKYGLRQLARNPGFTAVAVLTLALGIAANTTIFSAVSAILLRKPPVENPDRLCAISSKNLIRGYDLQAISVPDFQSWKRQNNVFSNMAAIESGHSFTLTGNREPKSVDGDLVTPNYFKVTGLAPILGRAFLTSEGKAGGDHVVILSNALWHDHFDADPHVIGKTLKIDFVPYTVIGVMPAKAEIPMPWMSPRLWVPLVFSTKELRPSARGKRDLSMVLGRLRPGVTLQQAQAEMSSIAHRLAQDYPKTNKDWGATVLTLQEYLIRKPVVRAALTLLMVMVGLVLLIACANIAGLLLSRGAARAHEMSVRSAVGASRLRLVRQMLTERLLIGIAGGGSGLLMSVWGISLLRASFNFNDIGAQMARFIHLDRRTLLFSILVSLLTVIVFGLVPAIRASRASPGDALTEGGRTGSGTLTHNRLRSVLVAGEIALALALLTGAGLVTRDMVHEFSAHKGFNPKNVLIARIRLENSQYQKPDAQIAFFREVTENLRNAPGVQSVGVATDVPFNGFSSTSFSVVGQPQTPKSKRPSADYIVAGPNFFRTMEITLMKGREFSSSDGLHTPIVAVVNQEFARRFFPSGNAIGQHIEVDKGHHQALIIGIVDNVSDYVGQLSPTPQIYESYLQTPSPNMVLAVRSAITPSALAPEVRRAVWSVYKDQPIGRIWTMQEIAANNVGGDKVMAALMGISAGLALMLAAIGIYGVIAYSVSQRTREIGIRIALGAETKDVLRLVFRQGGLLAGIGCAVGLALALPLPRVFMALFDGFVPQGPLIAIAVFFIVAGVCLGAIYIPGRRAANVDPMVALRYE